jgi:hypothetical protein
VWQVRYDRKQPPPAPEGRELRVEGAGALDSVDVLLTELEAALPPLATEPAGAPNQPAPGSSGEIVRPRSIAAEPPPAPSTGLRPSPPPVRPGAPPVRTSPPPRPNAIVKPPPPRIPPPPPPRARLGSSFPPPPPPRASAPPPPRMQIFQPPPPDDPPARMPSFVPPPVPDFNAIASEPPSPPLERPVPSERPPVLASALPDFARAPATEKTDVDLRVRAPAMPAEVEASPPFVDISYEAPDEESVTVPHARVPFDRVAAKPDDGSQRAPFPRRQPTPLPEVQRGSAPAAFVPREDRDPFVSRMKTEVVKRPSATRGLVWLAIALVIAIAIGAAVAVVWSGVLDGELEALREETSAPSEPAAPASPAEPAVVPTADEPRADDRAPAEAQPPEPSTAEAAPPPPADAPEAVEEPAPAELARSSIELPEVPARYARLSPRVRAQRAERMRIQARREHAHSRYERAYDAWIEALRYAPDDSVSSQGVARSLARLDRMDEAVRWAERAVELAPTDPRAHELLGELFEGAGRLDEARAEYRAGLAAAGRDARLAHRIRRVDAALRQRRR